MFVAPSTEFTQLCNNSHNCKTIHTTVQQFTQLYNNSHNCTTIHTTVQQFTQLCNNSHNCTTIHTTVQQFTQLYNNSHNCTTIHTTLQQLTVATNWDERDFFNSATLNVHIVLQGSKLVVEFVILLKNGKTHFVNRPS